jgi:hypothetical protein
MAAYIDLLARRFPTRQFTIYGNDPRTLVAVDGGPVPTKEELDALMSEVDAEIESEQRQARQQERFLGNHDALLLALEVVVEALVDVRGKLRPASLTSVLEETAGNRLQVLRNRLDDAGGKWPPGRRSRTKI